MQTIEGQVFIRTRGAETFKLSLVDVLIFERKVIEADLDRKRKVALPLFDYLQHAETSNSRASGIMADYTMSADYFFSDLPEPLQISKTDADGKFSFKVSSGSYVLAAASSRNVGSNVEHYHWMVKVTSDADKKITLANDNLCSNHSGDSLIFALDQGYAPTSDLDIMAKRGIRFVEAFVENNKRERVDAEAAKKQGAEIAKKEAAAAAAAEATKMEAAAAAAVAAEGAKKELERQDELEIFRKNPKAAQRKAIELYPELGVAGSPINKEFVERTKRYQTEKKAFFAEPDWPVRLAKECSEALATKPIPK